MMFVLPAPTMLLAIAETPEGRELIESWIALLRTNCDVMRAQLEADVQDYEQTISKLKAALGELH